MNSWRAVWAYSAKRAARDSKTLTLKENKAKAVIAGEKSARTPRFVKTTKGVQSLDEKSLARHRPCVQCLTAASGARAMAQSRTLLLGTELPLGDGFEVQAKAEGMCDSHDGC